MNEPTAQYLHLGTSRRKVKRRMLTEDKK